MFLGPDKPKREHKKRNDGTKNRTQRTLPQKQEAGAPQLTIGALVFFWHSRAEVATWGFTILLTLFRMRLFCLQLEASCLQWSFLTVDNFSFFAYSFGFFTYNSGFFTYSWSFFAYSGKVRLIRALRDCKQRSLTASNKAPTVSKKASNPFWTAPERLVNLKALNSLISGSGREPTRFLHNAVLEILHLASLLRVVNVQSRNDLLSWTPYADAILLALAGILPPCAHPQK